MAASATDYFMKVGRSTATTLSAPGYTTGDTSINVSSTTNWPTTTGVMFAIDTIGSDGLRVSGTYNTFRGTVNSATQITNVTYVGGDANQNYSAGSTTRVYILAQSDWANRAVDGLLAAGLNQDGTQTPVVKTSINDINGNEVIKTPATTSAVNEITVTNSATSSSPRISATGGDTNIDLLISAKGTGSTRFAGIHDGWVAADETLTYASATTFTCSATLAANLSTGDKIKLTQTTVKYFYVTGVSGTTVTVTGGTDYTLANAAITLPFYSKITSPTGFPQWFAYTPTITAASGSFTSVSASSRFQLINKTLISQGSIVITTNGTAASAIFMTIPVTAQSSNRMAGCGRGNVVSGIMQQIHIPGDATKAQISTATGTYGGASGETIIFEITYEVA